MATHLPSCFLIQFLEQLLKFRVNFTLLKYVKSQRRYGFLITKQLIFGFQILDLKDHFSASLSMKVAVMHVTINEVLSDLCKILTLNYSQNISADRTEMLLHCTRPSCNIPPETSKSVHKRPNCIPFYA